MVDDHVNAVNVKSKRSEVRLHSSCCLCSSPSSSRGPVLFIHHLQLTAKMRQGQHTLPTPKGNNSLQSVHARVRTHTHTHTVQTYLFKHEYK